MPSHALSRSLRAADQPNCPAFAVGTGPMVRAAADRTLQRLDAETPIGLLPAWRVRRRVASLHRAHLALGGQLALPELGGLEKPELLRLAATLRAANARPLVLKPGGKLL